MKLELEEKLSTIKSLSEEEVKKAIDATRQANNRIHKALQDISRQGLAGSFTSQSEKLGQERILWILAFILSIIGLIGVAIYAVFASVPHGQIISPSGAGPVNAGTMSNVITNNNSQGGLLDNLLHELPIATPLVWFGWFSARQLGMLARIQQDYNYKASTAVAFEGYKKEVEAANDQALSKQLLETSIKNFGDNPVRLYNGKNDHAMPIEELLSKISDEKYLTVLSTKIENICKAIKIIKTVE